MPNEEIIIPPVRAGEIESELSFEYDHDRLGDGGFEAVGEHSWTFDWRAYCDHTGLDLGGDYPYVPQENGHTLRIRTEYRWTVSDSKYTLSIEQKAVRGVTSIDDVFYTRCGYYRLDDELNVVRSKQERQQYRYRERADEDIPHRDVFDLDGVSVDSGEQLVWGLHSGRFGPCIHDQLATLIKYDSPDDAVTPDEYSHATDEQAAVAGD